MFLLAILLTTRLDPTALLVIKDHVHIAEMNDVYTSDKPPAKQSLPLFRQLIFYDIEGNIIDWRMWRQNGSNPDTEKLYPQRKVVIWQEENVMRVVTFDTFIHTESNFDPEVEQRKTLPESRRKKLTAIRR
jgi:hypothetical protein